MARRKVFLLLACVLWMAVSGIAQAGSHYLVTACAPSSNEQMYNLWDTTWGYRFQVGASDVQVTALGGWDQMGDVWPGFDMYLGLFDDNGTLLASAHITQDNVTPYVTNGYLDGPSVNKNPDPNAISGQYRFQDLSTPITLSANSFYTLGALNNWNSNKVYYTNLQDGGSMSWDPAIGQGPQILKKIPDDITPYANPYFDPGGGTPGDTYNGRSASLWTIWTNMANLKFNVLSENVQGVASLTNFSGDTTAIGITLQFAPTGGGGTITRTAVLATDGSFIAKDVPAGTYNITIKASSSLSTTVASKTVTAGQILYLDPVSLVNGDVSGNNAIGSDDLTTLLTNMDLSGI